MCNAHQHHAGCVCGFGGDGHKGGGSLSWLSASPYCIHEDGFCRPTNCPKCGASVFFIRHNGGCLWVDELGKPWDKHPCFDNADLPKSTINLHRCLQALTEQSSDAILCMVASGSVNARTGNLEIAVMNQQQQVLVVSLSSKVEVTPLTDYQALIQASYPRLTSSLTGSTSAGARNRALRRQTYEQIGCEIDAVVKMTMRMRQGLFEGWTHMIGQPVFLDEKQRTLRWPASMQVTDKRFNADEAHDFEIVISFPVESVREVK